MVNIKSIVVITEDSVVSFNSWDSFWSAQLLHCAARQREQLHQRLALATATENLLAHSYGVPANWVRGIGLIFGTVDECRRRFRDEHTRRLLCDPSNRVVVQVWVKRHEIITTATVYEPESQGSFVTHSNPRDALLRPVLVTRL